MTTFDEFITELYREAQEEGPEAVAELHRYDLACQRAVHARARRQQAVTLPAADTNVTPSIDVQLSTGPARRSC